MKYLQIFLGALIVIGLALLATQNIWVPKLVDAILLYTNEIEPPISPNNRPKIEPPLVVNDSTTKQDVLIYQKHSSWGPCINSSSGCFSNISLYTSGRMIAESENGVTETQPGKVFVEQIQQAIQQTGIMKKSCTANIVVDYSASYKIVYGGVEKNIIYPGCEEEIKIIDALFKKQ